jgi:HEAT repeat protein
MSTGKSHIPSDAKLPYGSGGDAVAEICKALKASSFYPENHPLRNNIINRAYNFLIGAINGRDLSLVITLNGLSSAEGRPPVENTLAAKTLARELFTREIQRLSFLPDLSLMDFELFLSLLMTDPQKIISDGGMENILAELGIRSIITNEIDITAVFTKKSASEQESSEASAGINEYRETVAPADFLPPDQMEEMKIDEIIEALKKEEDDGRYDRLAGILQSKARIVKTQGLFSELVPILLFLINQSSDTVKSPSQQASAQGVFEDLAEGTATDHLLEKLKERDFNSRETVYLILNRLGEKAAGPAIRNLINSGDIHSRKAIATALVRIGSPAVPSLTSFLQDPKWYVVRSMLTILGEIGCRDCIKELHPVIYHDDARVRKEAVRCLTKTGGPEAADTLLELLADRDPSIVKQAIFSLGILKNEKAVDGLMAIVGKRDIFLKSLPLKKEAIRAIGVIGSRKTLPALMKLATKRRWFAADRWQELKISAIEAIAMTDGQSAFDFLLSMSAHKGAIGRTCRDALNSINGKTT